MRRRGRGANVSVTFYCLIVENSVIEQYIKSDCLFYLLLTLREFFCLISTTSKQKLDTDLGFFNTLHIVVSLYFSCVRLQVRL